MNGIIVRSGAFVLAAALALQMGSYASMNTYAAEDETDTLVLTDPVIDTESEEAASMNSGQIVTYDCVWFGSYPQAEVVSSDMASIDEDGNVSLLSYAMIGGDYIRSDDLIVDDEAYAKLTAAEESEWSEDGDITIDGETYRRLSSDDATTASTNTTGGYYYWANDEDRYHYFKYEPVKWRVLSVDEDSNQALLMADICLDDQPYYVNSATSAVSGVTYDVSTIRSWLNGYGKSENKKSKDYTKSNFMDAAFSAAERAAIPLTTVKNTASMLQSNVASGDDTEDYIFLPSDQEMFQYNDIITDAFTYGFAEDYNTADEGRQRQASAYARAMGAFSGNANYPYNCAYFLRTTVYNSTVGNTTYTTAKFVNQITYSGAVSAVNNVSRNVGVCPALYLDLSKTNLYSYAGTVSTDGTMSETENDRISIAQADIILSLPEDGYVYTGDEITQEITVSYKEEILSEGLDYQISYTNNVSAGTAEVTVSGIGDYMGSVTKTFVISGTDISDAAVTLEYDSVSYDIFDVSPKTPAVTSVVLGDAVLPENTYTVSYEDNVELGTATVIVTGNNEAGYTGETTAAFEIVKDIITLEETDIDEPKQDEEAGTVTWDCVWFGSYPQAEVITQEMSEEYQVYYARYGGIGSNNGAVLDTVQDGDTIVDDELYAALKGSQDWDSNNDLILGGVKYHRLRGLNATTKYAEKTSGYYIWENMTTYHYFKYEPVKWRVLSVDEENDQMLLLSDKILDTQLYNSVNKKVTWAGSTIRSWLNGYSNLKNDYGTDYRSQNFSDQAFSDNEQEVLVKNRITAPEGTSSVTDRIFFLSEENIKNGAYGTLKDALRSKSSTYAKAMGLYSAIPSNGRDTASLNYCNWWTLSWYSGIISGKNVTSYATNAGISREVSLGIDVNTGYIGVRPALILDTSAEQYGYAGTVSSNGIIREQEETTSLAAALVDFEENLSEESGEEILEGMTVYLNGQILEKDVDYKAAFHKTVTEQGQTEILITITGCGNYNGYASVSYPETAEEEEEPDDDLNHAAVDNGLANEADADGNWYYYTDGRIDTSYTGFAANKNGSWYVTKGKVTFKDNSVIKDASGAIGTKGTWYYVVGSKVQTSYTGVADYKNANGWWYIKKGKVDFSANTVAKNKNGWWYIKKGKVDFSANTVANNKNGWWYVVGGKVQFDYTGVANYKNANGWWYIKKGKVDFTYTGKAKNKNGTWNVVKGKVVF